jgi:hypothetical protein
MKEPNRFDEAIHRPVNICCGVLSWEKWRRTRDRHLLLPEWGSLPDGFLELSRCT